MTKKRMFGFTLIELLVVIAIIGVLATLMLFGMRIVRKRAIDTQIKTDVRGLVSAVFSYGLDHGDRYPLTNGIGGGVEALMYDQANENMRSLTSELLVEGKYIQTIPENPAGIGTYKYYRYTSDGETFEIRGMLASNPLVLFRGGVASGDDIKFDNRESGQGVSYKVFFDSIRSGLWITQKSVSGDSVTGVKLAWRTAYGTLLPLRYQVQYRKSTDSVWLDDGTFVYNLLANSDPIDYTFDSTSSWDFRLVAYDGLDNNSLSSLFTPKIEGVVFGNNDIPSSALGQVEFYVCTKDYGDGPCNLNPVPSDAENLVYVLLSSTITVNFDAYQSVLVEYKKTTENTWSSQLGMRSASCDGELCMDGIIMYVPKGTYDFRLKLQNKNGASISIKVGVSTRQSEDPNDWTSRVGVDGSSALDVQPPYFNGGSWMPVSVTKVSAGKYNVRWEPAGDNTEIESYRIVINGTSVDKSNILNPQETFSGLVADKLYNVQAYAKDIYGNISMMTQGNFTTPKD